MIWAALYIVSGYVVAAIAGKTRIFAPDDDVAGILCVLFWPLAIGALISHRAAGK